MNDLRDLETALRDSSIRPTPIQPKTWEQLETERTRVQIPTLPFISLGEECVSRVLVKFNVGGNFQNVPLGVKERKPTMNSTARMAANIQKAVEVGGEELTDKNRIPGRTHDTAIGLLGGKNVKLLRVGAMPSLQKAGLKLTDVNCQRSGGGNYIVAFEYNRTAPEQTFPHCEERLAKELEARFSKATSQMTTIFWNPNKTVTVNVGPYCAARAEKVLVVSDNAGVPALRLADLE